MTQKQIAYLQQVLVYMKMLDHAAQKLNEIWLKDGDSGVDLNEFMAEKYPFNDSFDDVAYDIREWLRDYSKKLSYTIDDDQQGEVNDPPPSPRYKKVCFYCGSDDVLADAYAVWNVAKQEWEIHEVYDKTHYCNNCDGECRIIDVELKITAMKMFTNEQMTGSGQTNMIDLIQANEDRIAELKETPHSFWRDPGHGWLEVQRSDLIVLDIESLVTAYSYRDGDTVYLEEDYDAGLFINALFGKDGERTPQQDSDFKLWVSMLVEQESDHIRDLKHFKK